MKDKRSYLCLLLCICILTSGCAAFVAGAAVGGAGIIWYKGKLEDTISAPLPHVHKAVRAGLYDLQVRIVEDRGDHLSAKVKAKLSDGKDVSIDLDPVDEKFTKITIRVGLIGDEALSRRILEAIKKHV